MTALGLLLAAPAAVARTSTDTSTSTDTATDTPASTPVILIGTSGLRWDDVSALATPALWELSREGAVGLVAARGATSTGCPADGWLTVSTGTRSADLEVADGTCRAVQEPGADGRVPGWSDYLSAADSQSWSARPGLLGQVLAEAGTVATGIGPGAAVALAQPDGSVVGTHVRRPATSSGLDQAVRDAVLGGSQLVVVDAGTVRDPGWATRARPSSEPGTEPAVDDPLVTEDDPSVTEVVLEPTRAQQVARVDGRIASVLQAARASDATVLVVSLAGSGRSALQLVAAIGPTPDGGRYETALLTSGSTRQVGLAQSTDVTPTLLAALGLGTSEPALTGARIVPVAGPETANARVDTLLSIAREALQVTRVSGVYTTRLVLAQAILFVVAAVILTRTGRASGTPLRPALRGLQVVSLALAAAPVSSFLTGLVPWWLSDSPGTAFWLVLAGWVVVITAAALLGPWRGHLLGPAGAVAAVTVLTLVLDMLTGSNLVVDSPMGAHRILAARFYGMSNQAFALLAGAGLLLAAVVAQVLVERGRRALATAAVAAIGVLVVVVDGTPGLGSDLGGPPALILAFTVLTLAVSGRRVRWQTLLVVAVVAAVLVGGVTVADWMRPPGDRTHLGRFLATALDGGLWDVVYRKLSVNLRVLTSWRYLLLAIGGILLTALVLAGPRPRRGGLLGSGSPLAGLQEAVPLLRPTVAAIGVALTIGFLINDSGIVVPATGIAVAVPCLVAASARWRLAAELSPGPALPDAAASGGSA